MKIMILSAAAGGGHLRAAHAVEDYIKQNVPNAEVLVADALKNVSAALDWTCCDGYKLIAKNAPKFFGSLYKATNKDTPLNSLMVRINHSAAQKLIPLLEKENPDVILSTYPFATEMISNLKREGVLKVPLICLMTDYGPHMAWIASNVDAYVVSTADMIDEMETMGVPRVLVHPFGIPVGDAFFKKEDRRSVRIRLGLDPDKPTILIMAGSFGVTRVLRIYERITALPQDFQMVVITGKNERLYEMFKEKAVPHSKKPTKLIYFTDEVESYMHASDLLVTKPGGLTVSEALACGIPLAVFDAIPGQEEDNTDFLLNHNMAVELGSGKDCAAIISDLLSNEEELKKMRASCEEFDKTDSKRQIFSLMEDLMKVYHTGPYAAVPSPQERLKSLNNPT